MKARVLRPEEWALVDDAPLLPYVTPENAGVVVVERGGETVARMIVLRVTHLEGLWIDERYRGNAAVARALLRRSVTLAQEHGERFVFGGVADDKMRGFMSRFGAAQIPVELYALRLTEET